MDMDMGTDMGTDMDMQKIKMNTLYKKVYLVIDV